MMMKKCSKCKAEKSLSGFFPDISKASGYRSSCKTCTAKVIRACRYKKIEVYRAKERLRGEKRWKNADNRKRARLLKDKVKEHARMTLRYAVWSGKIVKPEACDRCHAAVLLHGHHKDYSKLLDVVWLCSVCHGAEHGKVVCL